MTRRWSFVVGHWSLVVGLASVVAISSGRTVRAASLQSPASSPQPPASSLPELTQPLNDFAHVVDAASAAEIDRMSRALQAASGDVVVVATVPTVEPYGDINEYAVKLFENHGRGLGAKGKDNGVLILLALKERRVRIEVGYGLEQWITDGFAGSTSRESMTPEFKNGRYGAGLRAGVEQVVGRIAQARNVTVTGVRAPRERHPRRTPLPVSVPFIIFIILLIISRLGGGSGRRPRFWGGGGWSGWSSGVGPFGGGFGGGGGGFGGGFGGFGGGGSGGGGGGSSW